MIFVIIAAGQQPVFGYVEENEPFIIFGELGPQVGKLGKNWKEPHTGMEFVWIPEGKFMMGSPDTEKNREEDEGPVHEVDLSGFYMGKYEVTNFEYSKYDTDFHPKEKRAPVVYIGYKEAKLYCDWLNNNYPVKGMIFDLPSEAQWEYACRAGSNSAYCVGNTIDCKNAMYRGCWPESRRMLGCIVGSFLPNSFGLYDMSGNVWEWCLDWYDADFYKKPESRKKNQFVIQVKKNTA